MNELLTTSALIWTPIDAATLLMMRRFCMSSLSKHNRCTAASFHVIVALPAEAHARAIADAARGRALYLVEGCGFCHTQFVRDLPMDRPYGRPALAEDYALEDPPLLGTQRTGPDLSNVAARQPSDTWHLLHLYNPRIVVPQSVMPGYPWYFEIKDGAVDALSVRERIRAAHRTTLTKDWYDVPL